MTLCAFQVHSWRSDQTLVKWEIRWLCCHQWKHLMRALCSRSIITCWSAMKIQRRHWQCIRTQNCTCMNDVWLRLKAIMEPNGNMLKFAFLEAPTSWHSSPRTDSSFRLTSPWTISSWSLMVQCSDDVRTDKVIRYLLISDSNIKLY